MNLPLEQKKRLLDLLLRQLQADLDALIFTAQVAKDAATSEESKAENKYDTRGLEASYLAGAQAKRADELKVTIHKLSQLTPREFPAGEKVVSTALLKVLVNEDFEKHFFILPSAGGTKLQLDATEYQIITPDSVVGQSLLGKTKGDIVEVKINHKAFEYEILQLD